MDTTENESAIDLAVQPAFTIGRLSVDPARRRVVGDAGVERNIQPRQMQVLVALVRQKGETLGRDALIESCWGGRIVSGDAIERVIAALRALEADLSPGSFTITTIARVGYQLDESVKTQAAPAVLPHPSRRWIVGGAAAAVAGFAGWQTFRPHPANAKGPIPIALEATAGFSSDRQLDGAPDAQLREIATLLARLEGVAVAAARGSTGYLVRASADVAGDRVRTGATILEHGRTDILFSASRDIAVGDMLSAQRQVAADVLQWLAGWVTIANVDRPLSPPRRDVVAAQAAEAAEALLVQSRDAFMDGAAARGEDLANQSLEQARRALAVDPADPGGLVALAKLVKYGTPSEFAREAQTPDDREHRAEALIQQALVQDPNDPVTLAALADHYRRYQWRWQEAENLLRRALARRPDLTDANWSLAYLLAVIGRAREGLSWAYRVVTLNSSSAWYRLSVPRLLDCCGRRAEAQVHYDAELRRSPTNLFVLREIYLTYFLTRDIASLRALAAGIRASNDKAAPPQLLALADRIAAAADALSGRPAAFLALLDAEVTKFEAPVIVGGATRQGRAKIDLLYLFAIEYAWAGRPEPALKFLDQALTARTLYWPVTLPFGIAPFPVPIRRSPRFAALWNANPRLQEMVTLRRKALRERQMAGILPEGTIVTRV